MHSAFRQVFISPDLITDVQENAICLRVRQLFLLVSSHMDTNKEKDDVAAEE
jgi:hypothetical protein